MSNAHIKTAHAWGVEQALNQAGYASCDALVKEAQDLGLLEKTADYPGLGAGLGTLGGAGLGTLALKYLPAHPASLLAIPAGALLGGMGGGALGASDDDRSSVAAGSALGNLAGTALGGLGAGALLFSGKPPMHASGNVPRLLGTSLSGLAGGALGSALGARAGSSD